MKRHTKIALYTIATIAALSTYNLLTLPKSVAESDPNIVHIKPDQGADITQQLQTILNPTPDFNPFNKTDDMVVNRHTNTFYLYLVSEDASSAFERESNLMAANGVKEITINLHSPGGEIVAAYIMKQQIAILQERGIKIKTVVDSKNACMSACPLIFLAGDERVASADSVFMFHSPYIQFPYNVSEDVIREMERELRQDKDAYSAVLGDVCPNDPSIKMDIYDHQEHYYRADDLELRCGGTKFFTLINPVKSTQNYLPLLNLV